MKFPVASFLLLVGASVDAFAPSTFVGKATSTKSISSSTLSMVLEKPKELAKIEVLKSGSDHLKIPLLEVRFFTKSRLICRFATATGVQ